MLWRMYLNEFSWCLFPVLSLEHCETAAPWAPQPMTIGKNDEPVDGIWWILRRSSCLACDEHHDLWESQPWTIIESIIKSIIKSIIHPWDPMGHSMVFEAVWASSHLGQRCRRISPWSMGSQAEGRCSLFLCLEPQCFTGTQRPDDAEKSWHKFARLTKKPSESQLHLCFAQGFMAPKNG